MAVHKDFEALENVDTTEELAARLPLLALRPGLRNSKYTTAYIRLMSGGAVDAVRARLYKSSGSSEDSLRFRVKLGSHSGSWNRTALASRSPMC
jgi:hypothetical protein